MLREQHHAEQELQRFLQAFSNESVVQLLEISAENADCSCVLTLVVTILLRDTLAKILDTNRSQCQQFLNIRVAKCSVVAVSIG